MTSWKLRKTKMGISKLLHWNCEYWIVDVLGRVRLQYIFNLFQKHRLMDYSNIEAPLKHGRILSINQLDYWIQLIEHNQGSNGVNDKHAKVSPWVSNPWKQLRNEQEWAWASLDGKWLGKTRWISQSSGGWVPSPLSSVSPEALAAEATRDYSNTHNSPTTKAPRVSFT